MNNRRAKWINRLAARLWIMKPDEGSAKTIGRRIKKAYQQVPRNERFKWMCELEDQMR